MLIVRRSWLIAPALAAIAVDAGLTLWGQPDAYWAGDRETAIEGNPLARPFLVHGPWTFAALVAAWGLAVALVVGCWEHWASDLATVLVAFGHAVGGGGWILQLSGPWGWLAAVAWLAAVSEAVWLGWRLARPAPAEES